MYSYDTSAPRILDPDDNLMNKFQATLQAHLLRVENSLSEEVHQLEVSIKQAEKKLESESVVLYQTQQDVERQQGTIEQYKMMLAQVTTLRDKKSHAVDDAKEFHKKAQLKLQEEKQREEKLSRNLEKLLALHSRFSEWESDLNDYLIISKRISERDGNKEKELIDRKQQRDCILSQLEERIWGIEAEVAYLDKQLQIKDREKTNANRIIIDTSTDLETLHREHKDLCDTWNSTVASISKRNVIYDQLQLERDETHKSYKELILGLEKVKKETNKEVEVNEHLTSVSFKLDLNLDVVSKLLSTENEKIANIEAGLIKFSKLKEQAENNYNALYIVRTST